MGTTTLVFTALLLLLLASGSAEPPANATSQWLGRLQQRRRGCRFRPRTCRDPSNRYMRCCGNRCVDLRYDPDDCGLCGFRCRLSRQCCDGSCVDVMWDPFHCGNCQTRCPFPVLCEYGMCGYGDLGFPFRFPPRRLPSPSPPPVSDL